MRYKRLASSLLVFTFVLSGQDQAVQLVQNAAANTGVPDKTVVAVINGKNVTAAEVRDLLAGTPSQAWPAFMTDPAQFLRNYAWYMHLVSDAEKRGLDKQSPYREQMAFQRMQLLTMAQHAEAKKQIVVTRDEEKKYYDENRERFREVQAKLIYVPFSSTGDGKKVLTEEQALKKSASIAKQAQAGADFVKLVKEHSEDPGSVAQNGDIGTGIRTNTTNIPEPMRKAVLALKVKQVSEPVRHENGYYVFRAESESVLPYDTVREEIYNDLKQQGFLAWQKKTQAESSIEISDENFLRKLAESLRQQGQ
ncbi:MAG TPA: peptidylprolyl isomerase [Bryobacteraceae bacterium]|nr:peptidylprolyl isomerase [Bryobacteraceae bacterium]